MLKKASIISNTNILKPIHFELPGDQEAPRIFISQLILEDFSDYMVRPLPGYSMKFLKKYWIRET